LFLVVASSSEVRRFTMNQRVALITGASQGLGFALAEALADEGWTLVIDARRADRLEPAASALADRTAVVSIPGAEVVPVADPARAEASLLDGKRLRCDPR